MTNKITVDEDHVARVKQELIAAGINNYGLLKAETRHLPSVIHEDEHIGAVIYGRAENAGGMIVATERRLLYLDHKLFFKKTEEISYDVVSGVSYNKQGAYAAVTVHTRLGDFTLRFVTNKTATRFVHYIENIQIEREKQDNNLKPAPEHEKLSSPDVELSQDAKLFLAAHDLGVISTIDGHGNIHGAAVYYAVGDNDQIYFATKSGTHKAQDILSYHQVAITIFDATTMCELQISGSASVEPNAKLSEEMYHRILHPHLAGEHMSVPPILHIESGEYELIGIKPSWFEYHDYKSWK